MAEADPASRRRGEVELSVLRAITVVATSLCAALITAAIGRGRLSGSGAVSAVVTAWLGAMLVVASTLAGRMPTRLLPLARSGGIVVLGFVSLVALLALRSSPPGDAAQLGASLAVAAVASQAAANRMPVIPAAPGAWRSSAVTLVSVVAIAAAAGAADAIAGGGATERSLLWVALSVAAASAAGALVVTRLR